MKIYCWAREVKAPAQISKASICLGVGLQDRRCIHSEKWTIVGTVKSAGSGDAERELCGVSRPRPMEDGAGEADMVWCVACESRANAKEGYCCWSILVAILIELIIISFREELYIQRGASHLGYQC